MKCAHRAFRAIASIREEQSGAVIIIFAFAITVIIGLGALTIDVGNALRLRSHIQASADSAALAGVMAARAYVSAHGSSSDSLKLANDAAKQAAQAFWAANATGEYTTITTENTKTTVTGGSVSVEVDFLIKVPLTFGQVLGFKTMDLNGVAVSAVKMPTYTDIYLMIDVSGSMALPVSPADQQAMKSATGCQFACHDGTPVKGYSDAYAYALAKNILLREGAINQSITALMDKIDQMDPGHQYIRTQVYSFSDQLTLNTSLTSSTQRVRSSLPKSPVISSMNVGGTHFKENIGTVLSAMGTSGTGTSQSDPMKILIIASDGAQDPGRYLFQLPRYDVLTAVTAFDMSFCTTAKKAGIRVGIVYTPYLPMNDDWSYNATLDLPSLIGGPGKRVDDIPIGFKSCAGDYYVEANDLASIQGAMVKILSTLSAPSLTR